MPPTCQKAPKIHGSKLGMEWKSQHKQMFAEVKLFSNETVKLALVASTQHLLTEGALMGESYTYFLPGVGNARVKHVVEGIAQVFRHDDGSLYGEFQVGQCVSHAGDDALHAVDLLAQEDVQRLQMAHLVQSLLDEVRHEVLGQFVQHVVGETRHDALARFPRPARCVLRLDADDRLQHVVRPVRRVTA